MMFDEFLLSGESGASCSIGQIVSDIDEDITGLCDEKFDGDG